MPTTYPPYDSTAKAAWTLGLTITAGSTFVQNIANESWIYFLEPFNVKPGVYTLKTTKLRPYYTDDANVVAIEFSLWTLTGDVMTPVSINGSTYIDLTSQKTAGGSFVTFDLGSVDVTIEEGATYFWGFGMRSPAGHTANQPLHYCMGADAGPELSHKWRLAGSARPATLTLGTENGEYDASVTGRALCGSIEFETANRIVAETAYSAASKVMVPCRTDGTYWIKFGNAVVEDGEAFTCVGQDNTTVRETLVLDMGATDQITFGGADVALAAAGAEAGESFDLGLNIRSVSGKMDLFYVDYTKGQGEVTYDDRDICTISHAVKNAGARDAEYTLTAPRLLNMSGTASVESIQVGWEPIVCFGDSQASIANSLLGYAVPAAFTYPRMYWRADIPGGIMRSSSTSTAGYLRYKHTTPGLGDLCEMTGVVFGFLGFGLNDLVVIDEYETRRNRFVAEALWRYAEMFNYLSTDGIPFFVIGLPPYSYSPDASSEEAGAVKQLNAGLLGLSQAVRCAFYNPWNRMVQRSTINDDIPVFLEANTRDSGVHYNPTAAAIVAAELVAVYESNTLASEAPTGVAFIGVST